MRVIAGLVTGGSSLGIGRGLLEEGSHARGGRVRGLVEERDSVEGLALLVCVSIGRLDSKFPQTARSTYESEHLGG